MPYDQRLLENRSAHRLLQNGAFLDLEGLASDPVYVTYPKTAHSWTNRTGITVPDVTGPRSTTGMKIVPTNTAGTLVISATGTLPSSSIGVAIVMFDETNTPIGVTSLSITTSGWLTNSSGQYIGANAGTTYAPGFLAVDVSNAAGYAILVQTLTPSSTFNLHSKVF